MHGAAKGIAAVTPHTDAIAAGEEYERKARSRETGTAQKE